jgi:hypothetical protein
LQRYNEDDKEEEEKEDNEPENEDEKLLAEMTAGLYKLRMQMTRDRLPAVATFLPPT